ncbi:helix-turn-helix transcriptional regulator [Massilia sp. 9096]|uniref:helix-turn-helix transcriptional regulator n=1 Tax=Massilia sp. 9096 TaxID=1500894 RepID=UPI0009E08D28
MTTPTFSDILGSDVGRYRSLLSDRLRLERKHRGLTQEQFAGLLQVSSRTYKRFELGTCDSLELFLSIVIAIGKTSALDLVFPNPPTVAKPRTPAGAMAKLNEKRALEMRKSERKQKAQDG